MDRVESGLVLKLNAEGLWLADTIVYHAVFTLALALTVGAVVGWFSHSCWQPLRS